MSLLYIDGFDHCDPQVNAPGGGPNLGYNKAAYSPLITRAAGRRASSYALQYPANAGTAGGIAMIKVLSTGRSALFAGAAVRFDVLPPGEFPLLFIRANTLQRWEVVLNPDGTLSIGAASGATRTNLGNAWRQVTGEVWRYIELRLVESGGIAELRVDGQSWLVLSGVALTTGSKLHAAGVCHPLQPTGSTFESYPVELRFDDFYLADAAGSMNNALLGDVRVDVLRPNGAGSNTQFTPSAGANWQCVDDVDPDHADYVQSGTAGHKDTYAFTDLPSLSAPSILGVQAVNLAKKTDSGGGDFRAIAKSGASIANGATHSPSTDPAYYLHVFETDPNTAGAWSEAALNAAEFGVEVV